MPTNFSYRNPGDLILSFDVDQFINPINNIETGIAFYGVDTASSNNYVATLAPVPASYTSGMFVHLHANFTNTGVSTVNFNTIGSNVIKKGSNDLDAADIIAGYVHVLVYDGTHFQLVNRGLSKRIFDETPSGTIDGGNTTFTFAHTPIAGLTRVYLNGLRLKLTTHYTISGATLTLSDAPTSGDNLEVDYEFI